MTAGCTSSSLPYAASKPTTAPTIGTSILPEPLTTGTSTTSTLSSAARTEARGAAVLACQTYESRTTSAPALSEALHLAGTSAPTAAQEDSTWEHLATDLTEYAALPEIGNTPVQEQQGNLDRQQIAPIRAALTASGLPGPWPRC
jgi:hypothetical protein